MRERGGSALRNGLVGLAAAGAVAYCLYRLLASGRSRDVASEAKDPGARPGPARRGGNADAAPGSALLQKVAGLPVVSNADRARQQGTDLSESFCGLEAHHIETLIHLLESTEDTLVQEQVLVTLSNSAAFSVNQDLIRYLGGLHVVGQMISIPVTSVKQKALNALNNLSMNIKNQEEIKDWGMEAQESLQRMKDEKKIYITKACEEVDASFLNSELQLAGLRFLTNMSVTNDYHYMMTNFIPNFMHLLFKGDERTQVQVLKVLVNLSANSAMTEHLLKSRAPFLPSLLESNLSKDILLRVLAFATNLTKFAKKDKRRHYSHQQYSEDSVFSIILGNSPLYAQKLASLLSHSDKEVKEQVAELIMQQG